MMKKLSFLLLFLLLSNSSHTVQMSAGENSDSLENDWELWINETTTGQYGSIEAVDANEEMVVFGGGACYLECNLSQLGSNLSSIGFQDGLVAALNHQGEVLWTKMYGSYSNDIVKTVDIVANIGILVTGKMCYGTLVYSGNETFERPPCALNNEINESRSNGAFISLLDFDGNLRWLKVLQNNITSINDVELVTDGFVISGVSSYSNNSGDCKTTSYFSKQQSFISKYNYNNSIQWSRILTANNGSSLNSISFVNDWDGLISVGETRNGNTSIWDDCMEVNFLSPSKNSSINHAIAIQLLIDGSISNVQQINLGGGFYTEVEYDGSTLYLIGTSTGSPLPYWPDAIGLSDGFMIKSENLLLDVEEQIELFGSEQDFDAASSISSDGKGNYLLAVNVCTNWETYCDIKTSMNNYSANTSRPENGGFRTDSSGILLVENREEIDRYSFIQTWSNEYITDVHLSDNYKIIVGQQRGKSFEDMPSNYEGTIFQTSTTTSGFIIYKSIEDVDPGTNNPSDEWFSKEKVILFSAGTVVLLISPMIFSSLKQSNLSSIPLIAGIQSKRLRWNLSKGIESRRKVVKAIHDNGGAIPWSELKHEIEFTDNQLKHHCKILIQMEIISIIGEGRKRVVMINPRFSSEEMLEELLNSNYVQLRA